jgi:hypothetical protein
MERIKVASLVMIALSLAMLVVERWMPEAHAEQGRIICNSWLVDPREFGRDNIVLRGQQNVAPIRDWLLQTPGEPVFRASHFVDNRYVETICVR